MILDKKIINIIQDIGNKSKKQYSEKNKHKHPSVSLYFTSRIKDWIMDGTDSFQIPDRVRSPPNQPMQGINFKNKKNHNKSKLY